ncbi:MAG: hypothetical protein KDE22_19115, partial [Rhodobacterales bacterium]|nr:hypothetical protein [Rhodobacterales bacterium]
SIKLGLPDSARQLNDLLMRHGSKSMAEDYLNSGSRQLADGGRAWASAHGYRINTGPGSHRSSWGRF